MGNSGGVATTRRKRSTERGHAVASSPPSCCSFFSRVPAVRVEPMGCVREDEQAVRLEKGHSLSGATAAAGVGPALPDVRAADPEEEMRGAQDALQESSRSASTRRRYSTVLPLSLH